MAVCDGCADGCTLGCAYGCEPGCAHGCEAGRAVPLLPAATAVACPATVWAAPLVSAVVTAVPAGLIALAPSTVHDLMQFQSFGFGPCAVTVIHHEPFLQLLRSLRYFSGSPSLLIGASIPSSTPSVSNAFDWSLSGSTSGVLCRCEYSSFAIRFMMAASQPRALVQPTWKSSTGGWAEKYVD